MKEHLPVGTYTTAGALGHGEDTVCGRGIYCYSHDFATGQTGNMIDMLEMENPSYLATDKSGSLLFAVNGTGDANAAVLCSQKEGELKMVDHLSFGGAVVCHVVYGENRGLLAIINYVSGSTSIAMVQDRQKPERQLHIWYQGEGSVEARQEMSHVHSCLFYEDYLLMADLGPDKIYLYRMVDEEIEFLGDIDTRVGSGPRHVMIYREGDGTWLYMVSELFYGVSAYGLRMGEFQETQRKLLYDGPSVEGSLAAGIHIIKDGVLYTSLRGVDRTVWFQVQHGSLGRIGSMDSDGEGPRSFCSDREERHLIVADQLSGSLVVYPMEQGVV